MISEYALCTTNLYDGIGNISTVIKDTIRDVNYKNFRIPHKDDILANEYMESIGYTPIPTDLAILTGAHVFASDAPGFLDSPSYATFAVTGDNMPFCVSGNFGTYFYLSEQYIGVFPGYDDVFLPGSFEGGGVADFANIVYFPYAYQLCMDVTLIDIYATFEEAVDVTPGIRREGNNYYISTAEGLNLLSEFKNAPLSIDRNFNPAWTFYLENDIDMSAYPTFTIGSDLYDFTGTFDGQGHSVTMKTSSLSNVGLFAYAGNATIKNLTIKGFVDGNTAAGGFIGEAQGKIDIIDCRNEANINAFNFAGGCIGVVEDNSVITVTNFINMGDISGLRAAGGVIGQSKNNPEFNLNKIYIDSNDITSSNAAGLIGSLYGRNDNGSINISETSINANLEGDRSYAFYHLDTNNVIICKINDSYFNGTGINLSDVFYGTLLQATGVFSSITKTYYEGFNDAKWVTGVNGGTAGLKCFLAVGSLAPVIDVETYLASKGFTKAA